MSGPRGSLAPADVARLRDEVIDALGVHFAQGDLELEELERRLALAFRTDDPGALRDLVADLERNAIAPRAHATTRLAPDEARRRTPERGVLAAVAGGTVRKGSWAVPRQLKVIAVMGMVELDLRQAILAPGVTDIEVFAVMGGVEIVVPQGVRVETMGMAFMGGFEASAGDETAVDPEAPVVRLSGIALAAGVEARIKRPRARALRKFARIVDKARRDARGT